MDMQVRAGNTNFANTAVILKEAWAKIGVTVDIQTLDTAVVRTNYQAGNFMSTPSAWTKLIEQNLQRTCNVAAAFLR